VGVRTPTKIWLWGLIWLGPHKNFTEVNVYQQNRDQEQLCKPTNILNGQVAGALLRTPVGELTALPQTLWLVWFGIGELGISNLVNILILTITSTVFKSCD